MGAPVASVTLSGILAQGGDVSARLGDATNVIESYRSTMFSGVAEVRTAVEGFLGGNAALQNIAGIVPALSNVALAAGPLGAAIAVGASVGSFFAGLFRGSKPPSVPNIAGVAVDELILGALDDSDKAIFAAKLLTGAITGFKADVQAQSLKTAIADPISNYLRAYEQSSSAGESYLRSNEHSYRAMAYFLAYAPYDKLFSPGWLNIVDFPARQRRVGQMIAWAAPRVQLWEAFSMWCAYQVSLVGIPALLPPIYAWPTIKPVPDLDYTARIEPSEKRLALHKIGTDAWLGALADIVFPLTIVERGVVSYNPIRNSVIATELRDYWSPGRELLVHLAQGKNVYRFRPGNSATPQKWDEAQKLAWYLVMESWRNESAWKSMSGRRQRLEENYNNSLGSIKDARGRRFGRSLKKLARETKEAPPKKLAFGKGLRAAARRQASKTSSSGNAVAIAAIAAAGLYLLR